MSRSRVASPGFRRLSALLAVGLVSFGHLGNGTRPSAADPAESDAGSVAEIRFVQDVAWSPDGSWIAFSGYTGSAEEYEPAKWGVFIARSDGTDVRLLAGNAMWVSWSPDGDRLVFSAPRDGEGDLHVIGRDGTGREPITSHEADDRAPAWSPDGREIAFTSTRDGNSEVHVLTLGGAATRRLTRNAVADHNPAWSPDGAGLVFYREVEGGSADQIHWVSADGGEERRLTRNADLNIFPAYLPDGRVTFSRRSNDSGEQRLVILDPTSSSETVIGPEGAFYGRWSPDGREVLFIAGDWPSASIYGMSADGDAVRKVVD